MGEQKEQEDGTLLESILAGTTMIISGVPVGSGTARTPCAEFDVAGLVNHLVGWLRRFEAALADRPSTEDPATYTTGAEPAAEFAAAARGVVDAWRSGDRNGSVVLTGHPLPRAALYRMMLGEYLVHGWDLARATGQRVPFTHAQAVVALDGLRGMLQPQYRGEGRTFGLEIAVGPDASTLDRLVAFSGRDPGWVPGTLQHLPGAGTS
jgi:uncharacterized protein (TIGR03086 family)